MSSSTATSQNDCRDWVGGGKLYLLACKVEEVDGIGGVVGGANAADDAGPYINAGCDFFWELAWRMNCWFINAEG